MFTDHATSILSWAPLSNLLRRETIVSYSMLCEKNLKKAESFMTVHDECGTITIRVQN